MDTMTTVDKGHGRRERRTLKATTALNEYLYCPGVAQVGQVESEVVKDGKTSHEVRYFITSSSTAVADAGQLLKWVRGYPSIENRSRCVCDETMGEDASRIRKRSGPEVPR
jgi:predicted transposase YbfD/YdcC